MLGRFMPGAPSAASVFFLHVSRCSVVGSSWHSRAAAPCCSAAMLGGVGATSCCCHLCARLAGALVPPILGAILFCLDFTHLAQRLGGGGAECAGVEESGDQGWRGAPSPRLPSAWLLCGVCGWLAAAAAAGARGARPPSRCAPWMRAVGVWAWGGGGVGRACVRVCAVRRPWIPMGAVSTRHLLLAGHHCDLRGRWGTLRWRGGGRWGGRCGATSDGARADPSDPCSGSRERVSGLRPTGLLFRCVRGASLRAPVGVAARAPTPARFSSREVPCRGPLSLVVVSF